MSEDGFRELVKDVDGYVAGLFAPQDEALEEALRTSEEAGLPRIQVSPTGGRILQLLAEIVGARRVLEIGTLGGYSAIWLARALPDDGTLISLELEEAHAQVARDNLERAGLTDKVEVQVGDARELLAEMAEEDAEPFDLVFIDADKENYPDYLKWSLKLSRPGSLIIADNAIRGGAVLSPDDASARATREFNELMAEHPRLSATVLPLIRERLDGMAVARVMDE